MALNLRCATVGCPKNLEHRGGEFIYSRERNAFYLQGMLPHSEAMLDDCKELYTFQTRHLNGELIQVSGKQPLDATREAYGVSHHQLNNDQRHWGEPHRTGRSR